MGIYLDNAATTKPHPEVVAKASRVLTESWGNPSSSHALGSRSKAEIARARQRIADAVGAAPDEIYFTSGGTESDNMAIFGTCFARASHGKHIVTTAVEHAAVSKTVRNLRREHGFSVSYIPMKRGLLDIEALERAITKETTFISVMLVNNEVGTIFPISEISRIIKEKNAAAVFHCDAVQGFGKLRFTVDQLGVDLLGVSAHKIHGIQGAGALYVRSGTFLHTRQFGGGQELGLRSGTESVPLIAAFGKAASLCAQRLPQNAAKMKAVRDHCLARLPECFPNVLLNTDFACAPHIINFTLPGLDAARAVRQLSEQGIYLSSGAACQSNEPRENKRGQPLEAYGLSDQLVRDTLRVSLCADNTQEEIDALMGALGQLIK